MDRIVPGCEFALDRCPAHYLSRPDPWRDRILSLYEDYDSSNITGWPDEYTGATVEAIRTLHRHIRGCQAALLEG